MSATNRSIARRLRDFYETPEWLIEAIIPVLKSYNPSIILEPASGNDAIIRILYRRFPDALIYKGDILTDQDFLLCHYKPIYDLIITNPPYGLALEFIERAMKLRKTKQSVVCMLLRLNFLGGQKRAKWLRKNTPSIYVSPRRPSFTSGGTDATEYCWMIWDDKPPTVVILPTEQ